jgi:N-acetylmuramoyl-L-alanine amidase
MSEPVVQAVPEAPAEALDVAPVSEAAVEAASLGELVSVQSVPEALSEDMRCLAGAIYFESRGESLPGQLAVGRVIVNRAASGRFPNSYCGVVFQRSQFSFVRGGSMPSIRTGSAAWRRAVAVAKIAAEGSWDSPAKGALFFHAARVSPNWRLTRLARVDNHIFYR